MQRVVLITGASSGIGYGTALAFARAGWRVIVTARRVERLAQLESEISALPGTDNVLAVQADVRSAEDMARAVAAGVERFGRLDALVANAGIGQRGAIVDAEWQDLETVLRTNIDGVLHSVRAAVPAMRQTGGGQIVIVSSVVYNMVSPYAATYAASKAFVSSIAASLRLELQNVQIGVTDLLVGRTESEFNERRLGEAGYGSGAMKLPTMPTEKVAQAIVQAAEKGQSRRFTLRPFDRLVVLANLLVPGLVGRRAMRQYK